MEDSNRKIVLYQKNHGSVVFLSLYAVFRDDIKHIVYIPIDPDRKPKGMH